jgi:hypothetical protein
VSWSSPRGGQRHGGGSPVGQRGYEAEEREEEVTKCFGARSQGKMRGERKGEGDGGDGAPYIGDTAGGRGWATGGAMGDEVWGRSGSAAWPPVARPQRTIGTKTGEGGG